MAPRSSRSRERELVPERAIFAYINHEGKVGKGIVLSPGSRLVGNLLLATIPFSRPETLHPRPRNSKLKHIRRGVPRGVSRFPDSGIQEFVGADPSYPGLI